MLVDKPRRILLGKRECPLETLGELTIGTQYHHQQSFEVMLIEVGIVHEVECHRFRRLIGVPGCHQKVFILRRLVVQMALYERLVEVVMPLLTVNPATNRIPCVGIEDRLN